MKPLLIIFTVLIFSSKNSTAQFKYRPFSDSAVKNFIDTRPLLKKYVQEKNWNAYSFNGNIGCSPNMLYGMSDRYYSKNVRLRNGKDNFYDSRFLGTWHTEDFAYIFSFIKSSEYFRIRRFVWNPDTKKYDEFDQDYAGIQALYPTRVDSSYFLEVSVSQVDNSIAHIPVAYYLEDNDHLVFDPFSAEYTTFKREFANTADYRNYVAMNKNKDSFYFHKLRLTRYTSDVALPIDRSEINQLNSPAGKALLLLLANVLFGDGDSPSGTASKDSYDANQSHITGYDKYWNPQYGSGINSGKAYYDANGRKLDN